MTFFSEQKIETDILVIGCGGTGCFAAIKAADRGARVVFVNKVPWLGGCTMMGRASYSAAMGTSAPNDNAEQHLHDSVRGGNYIGNQMVLRTMCHEAVEATLDLVKWGAAFKKKPDGRLDQGDKAMAGHLFPRRVMPVGEYSHIGKVIMDALQAQIKQRNIPVIGNVMITDLLTSNDRVSGAIGLNWRNGNLVTFNAKAVVMATGGLGRLFKYTDNPIYMTGDGYAAMYRAGAELVDMEFCDFQFGVFYPLQIFGYPPNCGLWLVNGGMLLNRNGDRFFKKYFPQRANEGECLRTEISRAAACEILNGKGSPHNMVYLDLSNVSRQWMMAARADMVSYFKRAGIDIFRQPLEVAPGLHAFLGGLKIDGNTASTTLTGLYAGGEAAGGWGGSNRLGGNAIASALGLGIAAGKSASEKCKDLPLLSVDEYQVKKARENFREIMNRKEGIKPQDVKVRVQELMQKNMWFQRNERGLKTTLAELERIEEHQLSRLWVYGNNLKQRLLGLREALESINLVQCGRIISTAALCREESRGSHHRSDYPNADNKQWLKNIIIRRENSCMKIRTEPVVFTQVPLPGN